MADGCEVSSVPQELHTQPLYKITCAMGCMERLVDITKDLPPPSPLGGPAAPFMAHLSLFFPTLVTGKGACSQKVEKAFQQLGSQGITVIARNWMSPTVMKIACRTLHHCFLMGFCLIYHALYHRAGTDAVDAIIVGAAEQSRFSGLLMVKNVLTYIITNGGGEIKIYPLAQEKRTREMTRFESCVRDIQKHGIYVPSERVLGIPGMTHIEHGQFPHLSALALGVSSVYQSVLAGVNIDTGYQALKAAAHQAELELQSIHNRREIVQDKDLTTEESEAFFTFHKGNESIRTTGSKAQVELLKKISDREVTQSAR